MEKKRRELFLQILTAVMNNELQDKSPRRYPGFTLDE